MDFRGFVLNELNTGYYYAVLDPHGQLEISPKFPNPQERDMDMGERQGRKINIPPNAFQMEIPGLTPADDEYEQIQTAFWNRLGFGHRAGGNAPPASVSGATIYPQDFSGDYWNKVAAKQNAQRLPFKTKEGGTFNLRPRKPQSGDETIDYPAP